MKRIEPNLLTDLLREYNFTYIPVDTYTGKPIYVYDKDSNITIDPETYKIKYASGFFLIIRDIKSWPYVEEFCRVLSLSD